MKLAKILAVVTLLVAGAAQAGGYADVQYYQEENRNTNKENIKYALTAGYKSTDAWDYSIKLETSQTEVGNGSISEGVEVRVRKGLELGVLKPYVGVRLGEKIGSSSHFSHYAFDVGTKFPLIGSLNGDIGYRYRNAFQTENGYQSNRYHAALAYALTKQDTVAVRYSQAYGDTAEEKNSWRFTYSRSF
jgi:hypothetical protein